MTDSIAEDRAVWAAAEKLAGHFALRGWIDMARDRGELRRKVRDNRFDPNEPTKDDCLEAIRDVLPILRAHLKELEA